MIRSNPTAIPLRPSDLKLLQAELDNRRRERDNAAAAAAGVPGVAATKEMAKETHNTTANGKHAHGHAHGHASAPGDEGVEEQRRRRAGMNSQERIGL